MTDIIRLQSGDTDGKEITRIEAEKMPGEKRGHGCLVVIPRYSRGSCTHSELNAKRMHWQGVVIIRTDIKVREDNITHAVNR